MYNYVKYSLAKNTNRFFSLYIFISKLASILARTMLIDPIVSWTLASIPRTIYHNQKHWKITIDILETTVDTIKVTLNCTKNIMKIRDYEVASDKKQNVKKTS